VAVGNPSGTWLTGDLICNLGIPRAHKSSRTWHSECCPDSVPSGQGQPAKTLEDGFANAGQGCSWTSLVWRGLQQWLIARQYPRPVRGRISNQFV